MELSDYIRILRKNWLIIVVLTLVGIGIAAVFSLTRTPLYDAESKVAISTQSGSSIGELQQGSNFSEARVNTYVNLITTPIVIDPVIEALGLDMTAEEVAQEVTASAPLNTTLINISVQDADPAQAAAIANALGESLTVAVDEIETPPEAEASPVKLTRVQDATVPTAPVSPNVPLNLALGALVGLALGIGVAVLRAVLDNRIRTAKDVELLTDRPIIGAIPFDSKAKERPLILHADPLNPRSEAFRVVRTNLSFIDVEGSHSFVITSSVPAEGKSSTAINLAVALADAGKKVALLDCDLRKPRVAEYLGIEGGVGLTDALIGRVRVGDVMLPWGNRSLYVMPTGKIPPNPSELLGSPQMQQLLEALERDFDYVICDAPPLLPVTDAAILSRMTTGAIMIVAAGKTTTHQLDSALERLETVDSRLAGIVMTMVATKGPDAYGYGYGYGYGDQLDAQTTRAARKSKKTKTKPEDLDIAAFDENAQPLRRSSNEHRTA